MMHATKRLGGALAVAALVVAGCSDADGDSIREQARRGDNSNYLSGDGLVQQVSVSDRSIMIELTGTTLEGEPWSSVDVRGEVLVINIWGSWCPPCVAEAPELQAAYEHFVDDGAEIEFIGLNERDSVDTALAFQESRGITYSSLADDGGQTRASLQGVGNATPATIVLDRDGQVAARVLGPIDETTLVAMVEDVLAE